MVAIAVALYLLKLFTLPQGGSVEISMLPVFLYCSRWDWKKSFLMTLAYGLLVLLLDGAYAWGPTSMLLDYLVAFTVLGVASFFRKRSGGIYIGAVVAVFCRFIVHFISGVTVYRIYAPTEIFNTTFTNPYLYSAVYNGSFLLVSLAICLVLLMLLQKPLSRVLKPAE